MGTYIFISYLLFTLHSFFLLQLHIIIQSVSSSLFTWLLHFTVSCIFGWRAYDNKMKLCNVPPQYQAIHGKSILKFVLFYFLSLALHLIEGHFWVQHKSNIINKWTTKKKSHVIASTMLNCYVFFCCCTFSWASVRLSMCNGMRLRKAITVERIVIICFLRFELPTSCTAFHPKRWKNTWEPNGSIYQSIIITNINPLRRNFSVKCDYRSQLQLFFLSTAHTLLKMEINLAAEKLNKRSV